MRRSFGNQAILTFCTALLALWPACLQAQTLENFFDSAIRSIINSQPQRPSPPRPPQVRSSSQNKSGDVAAVQAALNRLGYDAGPVDGIFGRKTKDALNRFQRDRGLPQTASVREALPQLLTASSESAPSNIPPDIDTQPSAMTVTTQSQITEAGVQAKGVNELQSLASPPSSIKVWDIGTVEGLPAFKHDSQIASLIDLVVLGKVPTALERNECALIPLFFTEEAREPYSELHRCEQKGVVWRGSDEFARTDMRQRFYAEQVPQLQGIIPQLPLSIAIVDDIRLGEFDATTSSFPLSSLGGLLERTLGMGMGQGLQFANRSVRRDEPPNLAAATPLPNFQLPMRDISEARSFISMVNSWVYLSEGVLPKENQRIMKRVATVELMAFDPDVQRLDIRLKSLALYDLDLAKRYYDFPIEATAGSVIASGAGETLLVPDPVELDKTYIALRQIQAFGEDTSQELWEELYQLIRGRDVYYYQMQERDPASVPSYSEEDARRPFFAKRDYDMPDNRWPLFRQWANAYSAGLRDLVEYRRSYGNADFNLKESYTFTALPGGRAGPAFEAALSELDLQRDQVLWTGDILIALPNNVTFYSMDVPGAELKPYEGKQMGLRMLFRSHPQAETITYQDHPILLIRAEPVSLRLVFGDQIIEERRFDDVPRLDAGFMAPEASSTAEESIFNTARVISGDLINLLLAGSLDPADDRYRGLIIQRWHLEQKGEAVGQPFFVAGKREPSEEEAESLSEQFSAWAKKRVPAFPAEVTLAAAFERPQEAVPGALQWSSLACFFSALTQEDNFRLASNSRAIGGELYRREQAMSGMATWTADDQVRMTAWEVERLASQFVTRIGCYQNMVAPEADPVPVYAHIPSLLPTPPEDSVSAELRLRLSAASYVAERPQYLDLLPAEMNVHLIGDRKKEPGDYIKLEVTLLEVIYRDAAGNELARSEPDQAFSLDEVLSRFWGAVEEHDVADSGEPYGPDIIGIQLGMSFASAESIIREHMRVGSVLDGIRAFDGSLDTGTIRPATSGKLFISEDGRELIALLDEAPAIEGKVLSAWRRLYLEPNQLQEGDAIASLATKYGTPSMARGIEIGLRNYWASPSGNDCGSNYTYGGQRPALSASWSEGTGQQQMVLPDGAIVPDAMLPASMLDPLNPSKQSYLNCGPVFTAELSFDASRTVNAGYQTQSLDWIEQIISDVGPYVEAYKENKRNLTAGATATGASKSQVKF